MGYQALLFCPDEKTARTVTQVLSELEFSVASSAEPFAAVKKLMAQHFDAIVVDCDNDQNATLLFKSARNSTANQASLAVAMVEGQAGVAKAFRIGANLVLTKPINVEQTKGTLRVARGLLRKGDPAKGPVPAQSSAQPATPTSSPRSATQASMPSLASRADAPSQPAKSSAHAEVNVGPKFASPVSAPDDDDDVIDMNEPAAAVTSTLKTAGPLSKSEPASVPSLPAATFKSAKDAPSPSLSISSGFGAVTGSAAGPARSPHKADTVSRGDAAVERAGDLGKIESSASLPAPSFSFGGANVSEESAQRGSRKALIGVAATVLVGTLLYVGWSQIHAKHGPSTQTAEPSTTAAEPTVTPKAPAARPAASLETQALPPTPSPSAQLLSQPATKKPVEVPVFEPNPHSSEKPTPAKSPSKASAPAPAPAPKSRPETNTDEQPIMVKSGSVPPTHEDAAVSDTAAPSVDIAPSTSGGSLPNLLTNPDESSKPVLQTLNVSQGVSQGLLIRKIQPVYPPNAIRMHVEGSVRLMATISKTGDITAVKILGGEPLLAQSALDAVKQWKYKPYYLNGDPVEIQTQVTINFKLPR